MTGIIVELCPGALGLISNLLLVCHRICQNWLCAAVLRLHCDRQVHTPDGIEQDVQDDGEDLLCVLRVRKVQVDVVLRSRLGRLVVRLEYGLELGLRED